MKSYKKIEVSFIVACQYGVEDEAKKYVEKCVIGRDGEIESTNNGFMGIPKNPFMAVKTDSGYRRIDKGDWIVKDGEKIYVVPDGVFQLMFEHNSPHNYAL